MTNSANAHRLWLASAHEYRDGPSQSSFSCREIIAELRFLWDSRMGYLCVVRRDNLGSVCKGVPVPAPLFEAFMRRCLDSAFGDTFLRAAWPREAAREIIEHSAGLLEVSRGESKDSISGLSLQRPGQGVEGSRTPSLYVPGEMRLNFGVYVKTLTLSSLAENIRRLKAAATA